MSPERADAVERAAQRRLHEILRPRLMALKTKEDVTAEKLEAMVVEAVREAGAAAMGELLSWEAWMGQAAKASAWVCPSCGNPAPRAKDKDGNLMFETGPMHSTVGRVRWRAPLFECAGCHRRFSPLTTLL